MSQNVKIVVVGSANTDMVVKTVQMPRPGETVLGGKFLMTQGGKGANQAVAAAKLDGDVAFVGKVGDDVFGGNTLESLRKYDVDVSGVGVEADTPSGVALITVDASGENSIVVAPGANAMLAPYDVTNATDLIDNAEIVLLQLEIPMETVAYAAMLAKSRGKKVVLNPAPAPKSPLSDDLLSSVDVIVPNETETEILTGIRLTDDKESWNDAAKAFHSKGIKEVGITLGSKGALYSDGNGIVEIPAFKVKAVDTTAAGDTFCGALCVALTEGCTMDAAITFANKAASIAVTRVGAQRSCPVRKEVV